MTVYVDDAEIPYGRMLMSHMVADDTEELLQMADAIGVDRRHLQNPGTAREHLDVCKAKRAEAVKQGALEVSCRQLAKIIRRRRET